MFRPNFLAVGLPLCVSLACGGGDVTPPVDGPLNLDIVAGQDQVAPAGSPQLSDPVVGQLVRVRTADGRWRFRFELVKTAYAQNTVNGSPVVGAVVCSETVAGNFKPFSVCTNTDANGRATFYYETGTKAGIQRAEVRGLNAQGQPAVFDTVRATVEPGPADTLRLVERAWLFTNTRMGLKALVTRAADRYGNVITSVPSVVNAGAWSIAGDSLLADGTERRSSVTVGLGTLSGSIPVTSVVDLRVGTLRAVGKCGPLTGVSDDASVPIDSIQYDVTAQSVTYPSTSNEPSPRAVFAGTVRQFKRDGTSPTVSVAGVNRDFTRQAPDSLLAGVIAVNTGNRTWVQPSTTYCWVLAQAGARGEVTFTLR